MGHVGVTQVVRAVRTVAGLAAGLGVLWLCFGHLLGPFDLVTFLHAGRQIVDGTTPYSPITSSTFTSGHAFVYPAFVAWLFAPLSLLSPHLAVLLYTAFSAAAVIVAARWFERGDMFAPMLVLVSSTTIVALQMGTVNPILLLGLAGAWRSRSTHPVVSGVLVGVVAGVKLFLAPLLVWPLMRRRYSSAIAAAATFSLSLATQTVLGRIGMSQYLGMLSKLQQAEAGRSWSVASLVQHLGVGGQMSVKIAIGFGAACLAGLWFKKDRLSDRQALALTVVVCLIVSPIVWSSYLLLMAAPLLLLGDGNGPLAVAALVSWVIVRPDQASGSRVAIGVALAMMMGHLSVRPKMGLPTLRGIGITASAACGGILLFLLPKAVRSPIPALAAMAVLTAWALRPPAPSVRAVDS